MKSLKGLFPPACKSPFHFSPSPHSQTKHYTYPHPLQLVFSPGVHRDAPDEAECIPYQPLILRAIHIHHAPDMHPKPSMRPRALQAEQHREADARPLRVRIPAIDARLVAKVLALGERL